MSVLDEALQANVLRKTVARLRAQVEVADAVHLSVRKLFPVVRAWCRIGCIPTQQAATATDPWLLISEQIDWLVPTDWLSTPVDSGWFTIRSNEGLVGLQRALGVPTNDLFIIQGTHACAVMSEEHGLELFDSAEKPRL